MLMQSEEACRSFCWSVQPQTQLSHVSQRQRFADCEVCTSPQNININTFMLTTAELLTAVDINLLKTVCPECSGEPASKGSQPTAANAKLAGLGTAAGLSQESG